MPAKSQKQQEAAGMALAAKRGEISPSKLQGAAKQMYKSMTEEQLREFAKTKRKGLPVKIGDETKRSKAKRKSSTTSIEKWMTNRRKQLKGG